MVCADPSIRSPPSFVASSSLADIAGLLRIARDLARALNAIHGHRITHNDLKLRNFLYHHGREPTRVQMLDFDLARKFDVRRSLGFRASC